MIVVMYHYIRPPGLVRHVLMPDAFTIQINKMEADGGIINAQAFVASPDLTRPPQGRYLLTFDDGLREHREIADELHQRGHSAFFFVNRYAMQGGVLNPHRLHALLAARDAADLEHEVAAEITPEMIDDDARVQFNDGLYRNQINTGPEARLKKLFNYHLRQEHADALLTALSRHHLAPDRTLHAELYLQDADLDAIARHHVIGNHGDRHRVLARLDAPRQKAEIGDAHDWLEQRLGCPPTAYCYAYGVPRSYDNTSLDLLRQWGYRTGFVFGNKPAENSISLLEIDRIDCNCLLGVDG